MKRLPFKFYRMTGLPIWLVPQDTLTLKIIEAFVNVFETSANVSETSADVPSLKKDLVSATTMYVQRGVGPEKPIEIPLTITNDQLYHLIQFRIIMPQVSKEILQYMRLPEGLWSRTVNTLFDIQATNRILYWFIKDKKTTEKVPLNILEPILLYKYKNGNVAPIKRALELLLWVMWALPHFKLDVPKDQNRDVLVTNLLKGFEEYSFKDHIRGLIEQYSNPTEYDYITLGRPRNSDQMIKMVKEWLESNRRI